MTDPCYVRGRSRQSSDFGIRSRSNAREAPPAGEAQAVRERRVPVPSHGFTVPRVVAYGLLKRKVVNHDPDAWKCRYVLIAFRIPIDRHGSARHSGLSDPMARCPLRCRCPLAPDMPLRAQTASRRNISYLRSV